MPADTNTLPDRNPGRYGGSRVGYLKHEVDNWVRQRLRFGTNERVGEPLPLPEGAELVIEPVNRVAERIGVTRVCLWRWERDGKFPRRVQLVEGPHADAAD